MPSLEQRLRLLSGEPRSRVASILAGALPHAQDAELEPLCEALVATGDPRALASVLRTAHRLGPRGLEMLGGAPASFDEALHLVLQRGQRQSTLNAIDLIERRAEPKLLATLGSLLDSPLDGVADRAARAFLPVVVAHVGPGGRRGADAATTDAIDAAAAAAAGSYQRHRRDEVLLAVALLAARPGPKLGELLADPGHPAVYALRGVVDRFLSVNPLVPGNLIRWLGGGPLAAPAARWMHRLDGLRQYADFLAGGHLLLTPPRRRAIRRAQRPGHCLPDLATARALPAAAQAQLPRLVGALGLTATLRVERLTEMLALPWELARLKALLMLLGYEGAATEQAVDRFCFDRAASVAHLAAQRAFARPEGPQRSLLLRLERSPHRPIAARATAILAGRGVEPFFERLMGLPGGVRHAAAGRLVAAQRETMIGRFREVLTSGRRDERLAAIGLGHRLRLVPQLEDELINQAASADPYVASAAVKGLLGASSDRSLAMLQSALGHPDARVRANAVESLMRAPAADALDLIVPITLSAENRPRANAVRAVLRGRPTLGLAKLRAMLADSEPLHRVSAIWVAKQARVKAVIPTLEDLARGDRLSAVRTRAVAALRLMRPRGMRAQVQEAVAT